jgi:hypothetical protein
MKGNQRLQATRFVYVENDQIFMKKKIENLSTASLYEDKFEWIPVDIRWI